MKQKIISISFIIFIFTFSILSFIFKDQEFSKFERRKLAKKPEFNSEFTSNLDEYIVDQFPFRNEFINLNSKINRNILQMKGHNNVYVIDDIIYDINYPMNEKNCNDFCKKINYIIENDLQNSKVYFSIIPDKEYFLDDEKYLKTDYKLLQDKIKLNAKYINIMNELTIDDYYRTDIHWKQENLDKVVKKLVTGMGISYIKTTNQYKEYASFYGASYSKAGEKLKADTIKYIENEYTENAIVDYLEYNIESIYNEEKLSGMDSYDVFLNGPSSLIEITNPKANNDRELIIFRDSFSSSLAPLLIPYYSKITLIDLRYINYKYVENLVDLNNKDVFFIYSAQIINNSYLLRVDV